jgi:hypothetical protein
MRRAALPWAAIAFVATLLGVAGAGTIIGVVLLGPVGPTPAAETTTATPTPLEPLSPLVVDQFRQLHWFGPGKLLVVTTDRLLQSDDAGRSWRETPGPEGRVLLTAAVTTAGRIIAIAADRAQADPALENSYYVERSDDLGVTWVETSLGRTLAVHAFLSVPTDAPFVALLGTLRHGSDIATMATSSDSGMSWDVANVRTPLLSGPISSRPAVLTSVAWESSPGDTPMGVVASRDLGVTWRPIQLPVPLGFTSADRSDVTIDQTAAATGDLAAAIYNSRGRSELVIVAVGSATGGHVFPRTVGDISAVSIVGTSVMVAVAGQLWRSQDGGATWSTSVIGVEGVPVAASFRSEMQGWIELSIPGGRFDIAETSDGGASWSVILQHA